MVQAFSLHLRTQAESLHHNSHDKPVTPLEGIEENDRVTVTLQSAPSAHPFAGWVGGVSDEDAAEMIRVIDEEFEQIEPLPF